MSTDGQDERARAKWEQLTAYMLNIDNMQKERPLSQSLVNLLVNAGFLQRGSDSFDLTSDGFHFVLLDPPTQVHIVLRKYIEFTIKYRGEAGLLSYLIKLIFNLALSEFD